MYWHAPTQLGQNINQSIYVKHGPSNVYTQMLPPLQNSWRTALHRGNTPPPLHLTAVPFPTTAEK